MRIQIIEVPYDSGHRSVRMGGGPEHFVRNGVGEALRGNGHEVFLEVVDATGPFMAEIGTAFELYKLVADRVRDAVEQGRFPLMLSGNCNTSVGTITGLLPQELGIIWFDGHADFNTPETTTSGFLDGMGLAIATGGCWKKMTQTIPGFRPIPEANVVLVGSRDIGQENWKRGYERSRIDLPSPASELRPTIQNTIGRIVCYAPGSD